MAEPWKADIHIDAPLAKRLISNQFPELSDASLEVFGQGWDNAAFLVDNTFIFRFPRRKSAVPLLENEMALLPKLSSLLTHPIPNPVYRGVASSEYPHPFAGYTVLKGQPACAANLSANQRSALAESLGHFLSRLHELSPTARNWQLPVDPYQRTELPALCGKIDKALTELEQHLERDLLEKARSFNLKDRKFQPQQDTLVHGDLYVRHLLLNEKRSLAGIIDWGDLHLGEKAVDLGLAWNFLPQSAHPGFRQAYKHPISEEDWEMARLRGLFHGVALLRYGLSINDEDLAREGRFIFDNVLA